MRIYMHLIRLDLLADMRQQHLDLGGRPAAVAREQRQRITIDRALKELHAETAADFLQSSVFRPRADRADFLVCLHVVEAGLFQHALERREEVEDSA
jgi:hypothetical protein